MPSLAISNREGNTTTAEANNKFAVSINDDFDDKRLKMTSVALQPGRGLDGYLSAPQQQPRSLATSGRSRSPEINSNNNNNNWKEGTMKSSKNAVLIRETVYDPDDEDERNYVCAQCFQPFKDGIYYEFEGRRYCEYDFRVLYSPCCAKCKEFIIGRVIKAMSACWHPDCFQCERCGKVLSDIGFVRNHGKALCHDCNAITKAEAADKYVCHKCHSIIDDKALKFKSDRYHPYHFNCTRCGNELESTAREIDGNLYCLKCHDHMGVPVCGACRRPIEDRVITALGKHWHVEHFVCAFCERPFLGTKHYEKKGAAYCESHYYLLFGNIDFVTGEIIENVCVVALNKTYKPENFRCWHCEAPLTERDRFFDVDGVPVCRKSYEQLPGEYRRRITKDVERARKTRLALKDLWAKQPKP